MRRSLGRRFAWLWSAYAISTLGTWFAFDAFALIAILVLHVGPAEASVLAATGPAVGACLALVVAPLVEVRRKRPVMIAMDLVRFSAVLTIPAAYALGLLGYPQLLIVSIVVATADIAFTAASGAFLKSLVRPEDLLPANGRFESTSWTATAVGPPLGGAALAAFGPVTTVVANAASYLLSALAIAAVGRGERPPARAAATRVRGADLLAGWRTIRGHAALRLLFANTIAVNGLIMATSPLMAILLLSDLGFTPLQYGLAFGLPCVGGLLGARLARRLVERFGTHSVIRVAGTVRACWSIGLAFVPSGTAGLFVVLAVQFAVVASAGVFNPVFATYRLERLPDEVVVRSLSAWSVGNKLGIATMTVLGGALAAATDVRVAIATAGVLLLATPLLLPSADRLRTPVSDRRGDRVR